MRLRGVAILLMVVFNQGSTSLGLAAAEPPAAAPASAEDRYQEARRLMQAGQYLDAERVYREVAESADAPPPLRSQSLFSAGLMHENARDYERAVEIYAEVQRLFPTSLSAQRAQDTTQALTEGGPGRWLEFRRRQDAAWDELEVAQKRFDAEGLHAAEAGLLRAAALFEALLRDYGDLPRARSIATTLGDTHMSLRDFAAARIDYGRAIELARRENLGKERLGPGAFTFIRHAEDRLSEATRAYRRVWATRFAMLLLATIGLGVISLQPWHIADRETLSLAASLILVTLLVALLGMGGAFYLVNYTQQHSPVETAAAGLLVILPGISGELVALALVRSLSDRPGWSVRRAVAVGAMLGAITAVAVATWLINAYALFPVLDSEL